MSFLAFLRGLVQLRSEAINGGQHAPDQQSGLTPGGAARAGETTQEQRSVGMTGAAPDGVREGGCGGCGAQVDPATGVGQWWGSRSRHEAPPLPPIEVLHFLEFVPVVNGAQLRMLACCSTCGLVASAELSQKAGIEQLDEIANMREQRWPRILHLEATLPVDDWHWRRRRGQA